MGTTPVCSADDVCTSCTSHDQCSSNACLPSGACGDDTNVAYIDPTGTDNAICTKATPCTKVAKALATNRPFVKFTGTTDEPVSVMGGRTVTFLADPGAKLTRSIPSGPVIDVEDDGTALSVFDLSVSDAPNSASGRGIFIAASGAPAVTLTRVTVANDPGGGIAASGGSLTISQSTISNNAGGGVSLSGGATFVVVGNVFFNNGGNAATVGGISITTTQNATNRLEFNSFNSNQAQAPIGCAVQCVAGAFTAKNNIMSVNVTGTNMEQVNMGGCSHAYSIVRPGTLPAGTGNSASDPQFVNTTTGDLHIQPTSPARHAADPVSDLTGIASRDIDGDTRTAPADIGADEVP